MLPQLKKKDAQKRIQEGKLVKGSGKVSQGTSKPTAGIQARGENVLSSRNAFRGQMAREKSMVQS